MTTPRLLATLAAAILLITLPVRADDNVPSLGRGLNLGNFLEAPVEGSWSDGRLLQESDFALIKQAGFTFVRVPIRWSGHFGYVGRTSHQGNDLEVEKMQQTGAAIDAQFLARIDWVVAQAEKNGLTVILDYHNDEALIKDTGDAEGYRFLAIWEQIAIHFKNAPPSVLFELLNEPNGEFNKQPQKWNALLARTLTAVRATNPTRTIVVGPVWWNGIGALKDLELPKTDRHLLVTVHYYDPMHFTHQGAHWAGPHMDQFLGTKWLGTDAEKKAVIDAFAKAAAWGEQHHRPIYLGEFGAYDRGEMASRARWTAFVARTAESHDIAWSYWEFCSGFGAYDPNAKQWREPLLKALVP